MTKSKVAIVRCESYDPETVFKSIKKGIDLIGGIDAFIKKGEKILIKPNNLVGSEPNLAVTTHPSVFDAVIRILKEKNVVISYGDSPGFEKSLVAVEKSGYKKIADKYKIKFGDFDNGKTIANPNSIACKKFPIANACLEVDGIISLPKMKTHMLTRITGAVKNQFGCVYGLNKAGFHVKYPNPTEFSKMLVDLNNLLKVRLFIMDGIVGMEGNGPRGGEPIKMNCLIISNDPIAVDSTFARMVDIDPMFIPTIKYGEITGLGKYAIEDIEYLGEPYKNFINKDFKILRKPVKNHSIRSMIPSFIRNIILPRPVIDTTKCVKCGICVNACPLDDKALQFKNNDRSRPPIYDYNKCIRCYCCQEMCPQKAIHVYKGIVK